MSISAPSIQQIVAVIRQQIAAPVNKSPDLAATVVASTSRKASNKRGGARGAPHEGLGKLIAKRIGALSMSDPERGRKALRVFLESILLNEFGENLINDPGFYQIVDDVLMQMENNPEIATLMQEAVEQLLNGVNPHAGT